MRATQAGERGLVFLFPGQGSYDAAVLHDLFTHHAETKPLFVAADAAARRLLGAAFLPLVAASSSEEREVHAEAAPELRQLGIFLAGVAVARLLEQRGVRPCLLVGHSFGELAAHAVAGVFDAAVGFEIVCRRVLALRAVPGEGTMAAASCGAARVEELLRGAGRRSVEVAVVNHPRQTVLSGPRQDLVDLARVLAQQGISLTFLESRHPFHSSYLAPAVEHFERSLRAYEFGPPAVPVYMAMERRPYAAGDDLPALLASQLTRRLDFAAAVQDLEASGYRRFVESAAGATVGKLVLKNVAEPSAVLALPALQTGVEIGASLDHAVARLGDTRLPAGEPAAGAELVLPQSTRAELAKLLREAAACLARASSLLERPARAEAAAPVPGEAPPAAAPRVAGPLEAPPATVAGEPAAAAVPAPASGAAPAPAGEPPPETCRQLPIAITSMGCVLPGAGDPAEYWRNVLAGVSGIVDLARLDPELGRDFVGGRANGEIQPVPDKSYTMLSGAIPQVAYDAGQLAGFYDEHGFAALTRGQKLLARALGQGLAGLPRGRDGRRTLCLLGATADGSNEYDEALFLESVHAVAAELDLPAGERQSFLDRLERLPGLRSGDSEALRQHALYRAVVRHMLGADVWSCVVDAACSSSLYAVALAVKALRDGEADRVVAGGVFAPGPANNTLFAQFRGLTPHASRPFDAAADGVVFGDGAAVVVLERLPDALAAGHTPLGVVRAVGLSSDGRSPSVNVPQAAGQRLALERAYAASGVSVDSIQLVEAHATATPVGDAVEFRSLSEVFARRAAGRPRVQLGSVKALIGHTGWVSGVASLIKVLLALRERTVPPQYNFDRPHAGLDVDASPFEISTRARPWRDNVPPWPRRAGVNGFGFGGTDAHVVVEAFDAAYHARLCRGLTAVPRRPATLAVVAASGLFPAAEQLAAAAPGAERRFERSALRLPEGKRLLPDVTEHMDPGQYLAALAADAVLAGLPETWRELRAETAVVLGVEGKTERGVRANERIFLDRLCRVAAAPAGSAEERVLRAVSERLRGRNLPAGPYTLPGLMPNVAAGRVSSLFDLKGPNLVVDAGPDSLFEALAVAAKLVAHGDCRLALAGGLHAAARDAQRDAEGILLLGLTDADTAKALGFPTLATLTLEGAPRAGTPEPADGPRWRAARGAAEVLAALARVRERGGVEVVGAARRLVFTPAGGEPAAAASVPPPAETPAGGVSGVAAPRGHTTLPTPAPPSATYAYVAGTPIGTYTPELVAAPLDGHAATLTGRRLLVLADQPELWDAVLRSGVLEGARHTLLCRADRPLAGAVPVCLDDGNGAVAAAPFEPAEFDAVVALTHLGGRDARALLERPGDETRLLDLLFHVCRRAYPAFERGDTALFTLSLAAFDGGRPRPPTGLLGGFVKSLARELPRARIRAVHSASTDAREALRQLALELHAEGGPAEVFWRDGRRETFALAALGELAAGGAALLGADSVVLATGGARGVTAVLAEELLTRFGCTVVALGRTDPAGAPPELAALPREELGAFEADFYRRELARDPSQKIPGLKRRFAGYEAAHEVLANVAHLRRLPGRFEYHAADLLDERALAAAVDDVYARHGRLDLVLHGAGVQSSKLLTKKPLGEFRRVVGTKLAGLGAIWRACRRHAAGRPVHFHLLTSAFSFLGNDGQPDYGAANEAMNRLAAALDGDGGAAWSSLAWLGWAGVGMTRGSEFAALAARRRLRGVTPEEGRALFAALLAGRPRAPVNVLLAQGEIDFYAPLLVQPHAPTAPAAPPPSAPVADPPAAARAAAAHASAEAPAAVPRAPRASRPPLPDRLLEPVEIGLEDAPYLRDHRVHVVPTLPGAFLIGLAARAAQHLRPERRIASFENTSFRRLVRVREGRPARLRLATQVVEEDSQVSLLRVQVLSDFVHKSGVVLQKDAVQTEIFVRLTEGVPAPPARPCALELPDSVELPDPYVLAGSPVELNGRFNSLCSVAVNGGRRLARYQLRNGDAGRAPLQHLLPNVVLVDAFWRFGTVLAVGDHTLAVYVPERCERMGVYFDYTNFDLGWLHEPVLFTGANPTPQGDQLLVGPIEAWDRTGRLRLTVDGGVCRKFGEIHDAF